ncbi:hypothetical protein HHK36_018692 [Tetracentron sinense]|uniref:Zinc-ribbon domain-containing protein n=1 Tax=Tetracentron sinense TaxID=13715 RepID=A0A835DE93_TETSI|nr:hypothetical protein HHK36_018692 [Tetracentron sinense]
MIVSFVEKIIIYEFFLFFFSFSQDIWRNMTSRPTIKVRLVRCPKCWGFLPELPDLPVYECGGCGTMLKGNGGCGIGLKDTGGCGTGLKDDMPKLILGDSALRVQVFANVISNSTKFTSPISCEEDEENVTSCMPKRDPAQKNESVCDSKEKEMTSSSREAVLCSIGECSLDIKNGRDQNEYGDCNERSGIIKLSNGVSSSGEFTCRKNAESSSGAGGNRELDENNGNGSSFISSSSGNQLGSRGENSSLIAQRPLDESISSKTGNFSSNEPLEFAYWDQDELFRPTRYGIQEKKQVNSQDAWGFHPVRNSTRSERGGFASREPAYLKGSLAGHENGSSSSHGHDEFLHCSSFYSSDKPEYPEQEKMELFRMVDELRDQLNRWYTQRGKKNGRVPHGATQQGKQRPFSYNYNAPKEEVLQCYDANYPWYHPGGYGQRKTRPQHHVFSQMPFSGQVENCRQHVDYSCLHCYDQDWQCPLQLPPTVICSNKGLCRAHHGRTCSNHYRYSPSSTQLHMDSDFPIRGHDTQINHKVNKLYLRERHQSVKRHCQPVVGRAPFIICYNCWKLLLLPADFLLSRKRCNRLRCGACSEVLKFSLKDRTHIVPYTLNAIQPLPSKSLL